MGYRTNLVLLGIVDENIKKERVFEYVCMFFFLLFISREIKYTKGFGTFSGTHLLCNN